MALKNLIDLIAEVAAKRAAQRGRTEGETPSAVTMIMRLIWARLRRWVVVEQKYST